MHLLITRPEPDASIFADAVRALGHTASVAPMLKVQFLDDAPPPNVASAHLLFTSANGVRAFLQHGLKPAGRAFTIGPGTAEEARAAGFDVGGIGSGNSEDLADFVRQNVPQGAEFVHVAGSAVAGDLAGTLSAAGYVCTHWAAYQAEGESVLPEAARLFLEGEDGAVTLLSPRTAFVFRVLVEEAACASHLQSLEALCLSERIAAVAAQQTWRNIRISAQPNLEAFMALLS